MLMLKLPNLATMILQSHFLYNLFCIKFVLHFYIEGGQFIVYKMDSYHVKSFKLLLYSFLPHCYGTDFLGIFNSHICVTQKQWFKVLA